MKSFCSAALLSLCLAVLAICVDGQTDGMGVPPNRPFAYGETLPYDGKAKVSSLIPATSVADLTFTVAKAPDSNDYVITGNAKSKGTLVKMFSYSFLENYESTIDTFVKVDIRLKSASNLRQDRKSVV